MLQNPTPLNAFKMTPVNTIDGGAPALAPSAPQSLTAPVGMAQPADVSAAMTQLDRLEAEAKALRQEALNIQTSIEQLQLVESGRTYSGGSLVVHIPAALKAANW